MVKSDEKFIHFRDIKYNESTLQLPSFPSQLWGNITYRSYHAKTSTLSQLLLSLSTYQHVTKSVQQVEEIRDERCFTNLHIQFKRERIYQKTINFFFFLSFLFKDFGDRIEKSLYGRREQGWSRKRKNSSVRLPTCSPVIKNAYHFLFSH